MPETTPLIKAALNLRGGAGFDVYDVLYARIVKLCIITVFLLFLVFGIKPILLIFSSSNKKIRSKIKIQLATFFAQS